MNECGQLWNGTDGKTVVLGDGATLTATNLARSWVGLRDESQASNRLGHGTAFYMFLLCLK
jgi:hypothetical protein